MALLEYRKQLSTIRHAAAQSYTSFMAPVSTHKLWTGVRDYRKLKRMETPYVVKFHRHHLMAPAQAVFTFEHPNLEDKIDNSRCARSGVSVDASRRPALVGSPNCFRWQQCCKLEACL